MNWLNTYIFTRAFLYAGSLMAAYLLVIFFAPSFIVHLLMATVAGWSVGRYVSELYIKISKKDRE